MNNPRLVTWVLIILAPLTYANLAVLLKGSGACLRALKVRAIRIEIAHSMSTDSFLCVLRQFIARRSKPLRTLSDNGVNFVGAALVLRDLLEELNQQLICDFRLQKKY